VKWERLGTQGFEGSRFAFILEDIDNQTVSKGSFSHSS
jgi:hypothetical protein